METAASTRAAPGRRDPAFPVLASDGPERPSASRQILGMALVDRADEVARLASERAFPGVEVNQQDFFTSALATRLVGRWLATGEVANADEHERLAANGDSPLTGEVTLANLTKSYLAWRDALSAVIVEESERLAVAREVTRDALAAVRASCDASLVRMGRRFDATRSHLEEMVREERARLTQAALHDRLTGLPNRVQFIDLLGATVADPEARSRACLLFIDLDHFKSVNDRFGHRVGDELLTRVGQRLSRIARRTDVVARFGGDEFVILARELDAPETDGPQIAERVRKALRRAFRVGGQPMMVTASVGVTPADDLVADDLLTRADQAMYEAKRLGRNRVSTYTPVLGAEVDYRSNLAHELHFALQRSQLKVVFQPICSMAGQTVEAEALLRWSHPDLGAVSPAEFIPIAEKVGLIGAIGEWVLTRATEQCAAWREEGVAGAVVSVNVSAYQLESSFPGVVRGALDRSGLPAEALKLEITESALLGDGVESSEVLNELGEMGVGLEIDDFGTGYSSLAYLRQLPVQALKIDRSFVSGLGLSGSDASIVRAMIDLAHHLGLTVVAEGVEETGELEALRAMGCDRVQGYLLGRPTTGATVGWSGTDQSNSPVARALRNS